MKRILSVLLLAVSLGAASGQGVKKGDPFVKSDAAKTRTKDRATQIGVLVEYIELDHRVANKLLRKHAASLSADAMREELETMLDDGSAILKESTYIKSRSGQRAKVESIDEMIYPTEYDPPEIPQTVNSESSPTSPANPTAFETRMVGTTLEVDPIVAGASSLIELNVAPEWVQFMGREFAVDDEENLLSTIWFPKFYTMKQTTAIEVGDGETVLLSINRPSESEDEDKDKMVMVLLRADILK